MVISKMPLSLHTGEFRHETYAKASAGPVMQVQVVPMSSKVKKPSLSAFVSNSRYGEAQGGC